MKKLVLPILLLSLIFFFTQCVKEDYFDYSNRAEILSIQLDGQSGNSAIFSESDSVHVEVANGIDLSSITINTLELSSFATSDIGEGEIIDFSTGLQNMTVTAEDGTQKIWKIAVFEVGSQPQFDNSDFEIWHEESSYLDIGLDDASSAWGTSNPGAVFGGIDPNVERVDNGDDGYAALLTTRFTFLGSLANKPIAAGSLFTGDFMQDNISITDPEASIDFGIPYSATPESFSIDYQYSPGPNNIDAQQNSLSYGDMADIYALLERRDGDTVKRVGTAWMRIEQGNSGIENITVDFIYGVLPAGTPDYMLPEDGQSYAAPEETPTHLKVVFSSSANGALFEGAEDSALMVDNFVLNY